MYKVYTHHQPNGLFRNSVGRLVWDKQPSSLSFTLRQHNNRYIYACIQIEFHTTGCVTVEPIPRSLFNVHVYFPTIIGVLLCGLCFIFSFLKMLLPAK